MIDDGTARCEGGPNLAWERVHKYLIGDLHDQCTRNRVHGAQARECKRSGEIELEGGDMGGVGSTRWKGYAKKQVAEDCHLITIAGPGPALVLSGPLPEEEFWRSSGGDLALTWKIMVAPCGDTGTAILSGQAIETVTVPLVAVRPHRRGLHWYWLCPTCGRRIAKLFLPPGSRRLQCRLCHDLSYRACQRHDRALDRFLQMDPDALEEATRSENPRVRKRAELVMATRRIIVLPDGSKVFG